jgi:hypothetical protein
VTSIADRRVRELDEDTDRIWSERERIVADARDLARQLTELADLAAQRFPSDPEEEIEVVDGETEAASAEPDAEEVTDDPALGFAREQASGFDELSAGA